MTTTSSSGKRKITMEMLHQSEETNSSDEEKSPNSRFSIAIVGGGIAGLGAALALQQKGFQVKVYERDLLFEDRRQGYGLTLTNNPKGPLAELDLLNECIARDCPSNAHWIFAPQGNVLGYYGRSFKNSDEVEQLAFNTDSEADRSPKFSEAFLEGRGNLRIPRQNLRRMMLERLKPHTVVWGMKLLDYTEDTMGVTAQFQTSTVPINNHKNGNINKAEKLSEITADSEIEETSKKISNNIVEAYADVLIGADGIRSIVRQLRGKKVGAQSNSKPIEESSPLHYVGVAVILGITTATHPLINQQGFYCLDGVNRLFTMPFEDGDTKPFLSSGSEGCNSERDIDGGRRDGSEERSEEGSGSGSGGQGQGEVEGSTDADSLDGSTFGESSTASVNRTADMPLDSDQDSSNSNKVEGGKTKLTMWQLSFSDFTEEEGMRLRSASADDLLAEATRRCKGWFDPVCDMINCTPKKEVWGTGLYDRNPMPLRGKDQGSRVTVMGDACHPMSMFKGQGANQALHDGPLLASWLHCGSGSSAAIKKTQKSQKSQKIVFDESGLTILKSNNITTEERNVNKVVSTELTHQNIYTRLRCFEREMVARTSSKVQASREAATRLHSPAVLSDTFRVEGVKAEIHGRLLEKLEVLSIGAHDSRNLEGKLRNVLTELKSDLLCQ